MPLRIFRLRTLAGANAVGLLLGGSFFAFIFIGTTYMQQVLGYSALKVGLAWLAVTLTSVAFAGLAQALVTRGSAKLVMAAGMALIGGALWATQVPVHGRFWADLGRAVPDHRRRCRVAFVRCPSQPWLAWPNTRPAWLRAHQHLPAARRGDRRRGGVHDRRQPLHQPAAPGRRVGRTGTTRRASCLPDHTARPAQARRLGRAPVVPGFAARRSRAELGMPARLRPGGVLRQGAVGRDWARGQGSTGQDRGTRAL